MIKIYSKVEKGKLLHLIHRLEDFEQQESQREDLISPDNFIQCSSLKMKEGTTFKPHKHIIKRRVYENQIAQESWIVVRGAVEVTFYDLDDSIVSTQTLFSGDSSFTLFGGHNYLALSDDTFVLEYKTGPYEGQYFDKEFIND